MQHKDDAHLIPMKYHDNPGEPRPCSALMETESSGVGQMSRAAAETAHQDTHSRLCELL